MELIAEFTYLEIVCQDQGAEIKQLKFEAAGKTDLREPGFGKHEAVESAARKLTLEQYFDVTIWRWVSIVDVGI